MSVITWFRDWHTSSIGERKSRVALTLVLIRHEMQWHIIAAMMVKQRIHMCCIGRGKVHPECPATRLDGKGGFQSCVTRIKCHLSWLRMNNCTISKCPAKCWALPTLRKGTSRHIFGTHLTLAFETIAPSIVETHIRCPRSGDDQAKRRTGG